jgi:hypothetical protein
MDISDIFLGLGQDNFNEQLRAISIGRLKTFQLYERLKTRLHLQKLNTENLRKSATRSWQRLTERDNELGTDISQAILVSHLDLIKAVLDFLSIPHEDGFFAKDLDASTYLQEGWQQRVLDHFKDQYPAAVLLFYINHLGWEVQKADSVFKPA